MAIRKTTIYLVNGFVLVVLLLPLVSVSADETIQNETIQAENGQGKPLQAETIQAGDGQGETIQDETIQVENTGVYRQQVAKPVAAVYDKLYKSLEDARFFVVFEPNIGENLARFSEKWGDEYNRNNLSALRSMVFCNGWYANKVSNLDPNMLGFCPLHLTLFERDGKTTVLFNRPGIMAQNSPAQDLLLKIENEVIAAIQQGLL